MGIRVVQVDAFTAQPFAGNPAAVCILPHPADPRWMLDVAREMNLAETAFLVPRNGEFDLRWFSPTVEIDLCGHATLASAQVLWEDGGLPPGRQARFHTKSGLLTADRRGEWIEMDFPAVPAQVQAPVPGLVEALGAGIRPVFAGKNRFDYVLELDSERAVRALQPDFTVLRRLPMRGVVVTARSAAPEFDFISRFFAPGVGVDEDPVTGSAHCCLAPYWTAKLGKAKLTGYQASSRGGVVRVEVRGDRVILSGQAVTVLRGELSPLPSPA